MTESYPWMNLALFRSAQASIRHFPLTRESSLACSRRCAGFPLAWEWRM